MKKRILTLLWLLFCTAWGLFFLLFFLIATGVVGYMPHIEQLQNPIDKFASQLISVDGEQLGSYARSGNNRIHTSYQELPPQLVQALIATEDVRFQSHSGVDFRSLMRAIIKTGILRQKSGGGSTITQQLAKQLYSPRVDSKLERFFQKPIEWVIAAKLERYYTKEEIITLYLNQFDFLYNAVGIRSASKTYFNKLPKDLTLVECATLVGMCNNPALYNPVLYETPDRCIARRNLVLDRMQKAGYISKEEAHLAKQEELVLNFRPISHAEGYAPYLREHIRLYMTAKEPKRGNYTKNNETQYIIDKQLWDTNPLYGWCEKNRKSDGSAYDLYSDGLKIYTTVNTRMQAYAEQAVAEHVGGYLQSIFTNEKRGTRNAPYSSRLSQSNREELILKAMKQSDRWYQMKKEGASQAEILKSFETPRKMQLWSWQGPIDTLTTPRDSILYYKGLLRSSFLAMNPTNGHVLAYVGGIDFRTFKYDMVTQGRRQVGSTIKPFLYAHTFIEHGEMTPCSMVLHEPISIAAGDGTTWSPRSGGASRRGEMVSLRWGLQNSSNWVSAYLMSLTSPPRFVETLRNSFGIESPLDPVMSLATGAADLTLSEMVAAYTAFVTGGFRSEPIMVTRIEDQFGNIISTLSSPPHHALSEEQAWMVLDMMQAVVNGGTGGRLRSRYGLDMPLAGKTGTTQNNSDGWFVGCTPEIVAGCWVGGEERSIHFNSTAIGQGANTGLPVFAKFIKNVYADKELGYNKSKPFNVPPDFSACRNMATTESDIDLMTFDDGFELSE